MIRRTLALLGVFAWCVTASGQVGDSGVGLGQEEQQSAPGSDSAAMSAGQRFRDCPTCPEMIVLPTGSFEMGSPSAEVGRYADEGPVHRVRIEQPYALGVREVTRLEFEHFLEDTGYAIGSLCYIADWADDNFADGIDRNTPSLVPGVSGPAFCIWRDEWGSALDSLWIEDGQFMRRLDAETNSLQSFDTLVSYTVTNPPCGKYRSYDDDIPRNENVAGFAQRPSHPIVCVNWEDAQAYVEWLSRKTGKDYRLPSEAEWEYAARAGSSARYSWGEDIGRNRANCLSCGSDWDLAGTAPAGSFSANAFGLQDMHGNAWEWVADCYNVSYIGAPSDGSAWTQGACGSRILRGGSWKNFPENLRSAIRERHVTDIRHYENGFRVALTVDVPSRSDTGR